MKFTSRAQQHSQRFRRLLLAGMIAITMMLTGCHDWQKAAKKSADEKREIELIDGYYSGDILKAERSLLGLVEYYSDLRLPRDAGPKPSTNAVERTLGLTHTRLYLLYSQLGRTNDAAVHRELVLEKYRGQANQDEATTWAQFLNAVEGLDKNREVKWKQVAN